MDASGRNPLVATSTFPMSLLTATVRTSIHYSPFYCAHLTLDEKLRQVDIFATLLEDDDDASWAKCSRLTIGEALDILEPFLLRVSTVSPDSAPSIARSSPASPHFLLENLGFEDPDQGGVQIQGDIAVSNNSDTDSCVQDGCKWPKSSDGNVYVPYLISNSYFKKLHP
ncbi:hypothetical protein Q5P01_014040 [Channa striata]|uniref:Uncharacterized protein n=1 Tax=Channa striata TaxID=64152 RepID=A0AA88SP44_CHASR|nr:hypothetical protein Q5P01_014040 [Channa striata]